MRHTKIGQCIGEVYSQKRRCFISLTNAREIRDLKIVIALQESEVPRSPDSRRNPNGVKSRLVCRTQMEFDIVGGNERTSRVYGFI